MGVRWLGALRISLVAENLPERARQRASDADRERVVEQLREAASDGRLDLSEFEERMGVAFQARTHGELEPLTSDLGAVTNVPIRQEVVLRTHGSSLRREGRWLVPRRLMVQARHGVVHLDLTRAVALADEVEVAIDAAHATVRILVPRGTEVVDDGLALKWGSVKYDSDAEVVPALGRLRIRLTGEGKHSSVRVREPNIFDVWRWRMRAWRRRVLHPNPS